MTEPAPRASVIVNGEELPGWLFVREFNQLVTRRISAGQTPNTDADRLQTVQDCLENSVEILLLYQEAERSVAPLPRNQHQRHRSAWLKEHGGISAALTTFNLPADRPQELEAIIHREVRYSEWIKTIASEVPEPDEQECRAWFADHPDQFSIPERAVFQQIFRDNQADPASETTLLLQVRQQWLAGAPAENLCRMYSRPATKEPGRFFDFTLGRGGKDWAELEQALFSLKPGEVSDVVRTTYGYHLVRLDHVDPAGTISFAEGHDSIAAHLLRERLEKKLGDKADALRAAAVITGLPGDTSIPEQTTPSPPPV